MKTKQVECEKYELAITNYVLGEAMPISKEELFNHLRKCPDCQEDMKEWQATYSVMRAEAYDSRPEVKARSKAFIKKLVSQPLPAQTQPSSGFPTGKVAAWQVPRIKPISGEVLLNHDEYIGNAAVKVWHYLYGNGKIKVNDLEQKVELPAPVLNQALGWLARGNQIHRTQVKESIFVYLAPEEIQKHQAQTQV